MADLEIFQLSRVLGLAAISFVIAFLWTPLLLHCLKKYKIAKAAKKEGMFLFNKLHGHKEGTLHMGGILIWGTVLFLTLMTWLASQIDGAFFRRLSFLSRGQTLLPW